MTGPDLERATDVTRHIARRVRELRRQRGWSGEKLAARVEGWTTGNVGKLETGRRERLSVDELIAVAAAFGVAPSDLLPDFAPVTAEAQLNAALAAIHGALHAIASTRPSIGDHDDHDIHGPVIEVWPDGRTTVDPDCDCPADCESCAREGVSR